MVVFKFFICILFLWRFLLWWQMWLLYLKKMRKTVFFIIFLIIILCSRRGKKNVKDELKTEAPGAAL
jgi:hypothetical protein